MSTPVTFNGFVDGVPEPNHQRGSSRSESVSLVALYCAQAYMNPGKWICMSLDPHAWSQTSVLADRIKKGQLVKVGQWEAAARGFDLYVRCIDTASSDLMTGPNGKETE